MANYDATSSLDVIVMVTDPASREMYAYMIPEK